MFLSVLLAALSLFVPLLVKLLELIPGESGQEVVAFFVALFLEQLFVKLSLEAVGSIVDVYDLICHENVVYISWWTLVMSLSIKFRGNGTFLGC